MRAAIEFVVDGFVMVGVLIGMFVEWTFGGRR